MQVPGLPPTMVGKQKVKEWMTKLHGMAASYQLNEEEVGAACLSQSSLDMPPSCVKCYQGDCAMPLLLLWLSWLSAAL